MDTVENTISINEISTCSASDIRLLNETKKYTLVATDLITALLVDPKLTSGAAKLWQFLYSRATYHKELKVCFSYLYLANTFGKSLRTIQRYVSNLKDRGYITIKENFNPSGQQANTIYIRFPKNEITEIQTRKNRSKISSQADQFNIEEKTPQFKINTPKPVVDLNIDSCVTNEESVTPRDDKIGLHNTNSLTKIKNNNNVVDFYSNKNTLSLDNNQNHATDEITKKQTELVIELENKLMQAQKDWLTTKENKETPLKIEAAWTNLTNLETACHIAKCKLEVLVKTLHLEDTQSIESKKYATEPMLMFNYPGARKLPEFSYKRLEKGLESVNITSSQKNQYLNEIIFEIRFGSLVKSNQTNLDLSIDNAINIALKLIRERRWGKPSKLHKQANSG